MKAALPATQSATPWIRLWVQSNGWIHCELGWPTPGSGKKRWARRETRMLPPGSTADQILERLFEPESVMP